MPSIANDLAELMSGIQRPGDFCTGGVCEMFPPGLEVTGVGPIALPLLASQADQLIAVAERAPFGRGDQTLVDVNVRRAWQINADQVKIQGRTWPQTLASILERVAKGLGVQGAIDAELYKLLIYDEGDFFVGHRDTEKAAGMFATLVIVLPSIFSGGELLVRHQDRETRFDLQSSDPSEAAFAAFYADCLHEVSPLTSGSRLTLIYNLLRRAPGETPRPPNYQTAQEKLSTRLRQWVAVYPEDEGQLEEDFDGDFDDEDQAYDEFESDDDIDKQSGRHISAQKKLIYVLEHAYTPANLSFENLKGADAARAATLSAAAQASECDLLLALLSIEESGSAEYTGGYRSYRRGAYEEDEFEVGEVFDRQKSLSNWRRLDGGDPGLGPLSFDSSQVSPPGALEDMVAETISFMEATGNEGASFERSYRKAALVVWPSRRRLAVINEAGLSTTLPYLADLAAAWAAHGEDRSSLLWGQAHELSGHMVASWPMGRRQTETSQSNADAFLTSLTKLGDTSRIDEFLATVLARGALDHADSAPLLIAIRLLSTARQIELLELIISGNVVNAPETCARLLMNAANAATSGQLDVQPTELRRPAACLLANLPGDPARPRQTDTWGRSQPSRQIKPALVVDVLAALYQIGSDLAEAAADNMLSWTTAFDLDAVLVPALLTFSSPVSPDFPALARLRAACTAHLKARISLPLAPPSTWTRASAVRCGCAHCRALSAFLADPTCATWTFKAPQADRSHLENIIRNGAYDLDLVTLRRGSPHCLVCTKNQASYGRRVREREKDLRDLARFDVPANPELT